MTDRNFDVLEHDDFTNTTLIIKKDRNFEPYLVVKNLDCETGVWDHANYYEDLKDARTDFNRKTMMKDLVEMFCKYFGADKDPEFHKQVEEVLYGYDPVDLLDTHRTIEVEKYLEQYEAERPRTEKDSFDFDKE